MRLLLVAMVWIGACSGRSAVSETGPPAMETPGEGPAEPGSTGDAADVASSSHVTLARSTAREPVTLAPTLAISTSQITLEGRPLMPLAAGGVVPTEHRKGILVPAVHDALVFQRHELRQVQLQVGDAAEIPQHVNLAIDAATPWATVAAMLYSSGQAEFDRHDFVVSGPGGGPRTIRSDMPYLGDLQSQIGLTVRVDPASMAVINAPDPGAKARQAATNQVDAAALTVAARRRKQGDPSRDAVLLVVAPETTWAQVVAALDATREDASGQLYPRVIFGGS